VVVWCGVVWCGVVWCGVKVNTSEIRKRNEQEKTRKEEKKKRTRKRKEKYKLKNQKRNNKHNNKTIKGKRRVRVILVDTKVSTLNQVCFLHVIIISSFSFGLLFRASLSGFSFGLLFRASLSGFSFGLLFRASLSGFSFGLLSLYQISTSYLSPLIPQGDVFILDCVKTIYVWHGEKHSPLKKAKVMCFFLSFFFFKYVFM
jgi:hypothetical protein